MNHHKLYQKITSLLLIIALFNLNTGCHYYRVRTAANTYEGVKKIDADKYVIIHFNDVAFALKDLTIDQDKQLISGTKSEISITHRANRRSTEGTNRYKPNSDNPINEVHLFTNAFQENNGIVEIQFSDIDQIDIYDEDTGTTIATFTLVALGSIAVLLGIVAIIVLLTKSSCPFVYINDGEKFVFTGETFGGAIAPNLERDDYMPLPGIQSVNGNYELWIANELKEYQYTDIAELLVFEHDRTDLVGIASNGTPYLLHELAPVNRAIAGSNVKCDDLINKKDGIYYSFITSSSDIDEFSSINLNFDRTEAHTTAQVVLSLKNTIWLDYVTNEFFSLFGKYYDQFSDKQKDVPGEERIQWMREQGMLLKVELKTKHGWKEIEHINMIGPLAPRDVVIPLDLSEVAQGEVQLRLTSGYHFWELDYAAIQYSEPIHPNPVTLAAFEAIDENGASVLEYIQAVDGNYLYQPSVGNRAVIKYASPLLKNESNVHSVILHTRGYYEYIRDYTGKPDIKQLKTFREPGAFARFSKERLFQLAHLN